MLLLMIVASFNIIYIYIYLLSLSAGDRKPCMRVYDGAFFLPFLSYSALVYLFMRYYY